MVTVMGHCPRCKKCKKAFRTDFQLEVHDCGSILPISIEASMLPTSGEASKLPTSSESSKLSTSIEASKLQTSAENAAKRQKKRKKLGFSLPNYKKKNDLMLMIKVPKDEATIAAISARYSDEQKYATVRKYFTHFSNNGVSAKRFAKLENLDEEVFQSWIDQKGKIDEAIKKRD